MKNNNFEIFAENVNAMLEKSGMTKTGLARALGMSHSHLTNILNGRTAPNLGDLVAIADHFAVPLDFLTGRCSREEADRILKDYGKVYMDLRRAPFEAYLGGRKGLAVEEGVEEPWPYNLYHNVFREPCARVITREQEAGIFTAVGMLPYREQKVILGYHQDGKDLKALGKEFGITPERVRLFLNKGIKTLRTEAFKGLMQGGPEGI